MDVRQGKCSGCFAEESGFLVIGFDQGEVDVRGPDFQGKGGKSGAGADVEDANTPAQGELGRGTLQSLDGRGIRGARGEEVAGEEEGLAEVTGYDFFLVADGGQVDAGVPAL